MHAAGPVCDIATALVQSAWFDGLCLAGALAVLYGWHRRCLARARTEARRQACLAERMRIARALHDTFLQSVQGLILKVDGAKSRIPCTDPAYRELEGALRMAEAVAEEGRREVLALREHALAHEDVLPAVLAAAYRLGEQYDVPVEVRVSGRRQLLTASTVEHLHAIAGEAIRNACQHANGALVNVELHFGPSFFQLRIVDDGDGIDPCIVAAGGKPGHWGLAGMRERAGRIGALLTISPRARGGTEVALSLPSAGAYGSRGRRMLRAFRR